MAIPWGTWPWDPQAMPFPDLAVADYGCYLQPDELAVCDILPRWGNSHSIHLNAVVMDAIANTVMYMSPNAWRTNIAAVCMNVCCRPMPTSIPCWTTTAASLRARTLRGRVARRVGVKNERSDRPEQFASQGSAGRRTSPNALLDHPARLFAARPNAAAAFSLRLPSQQGPFTIDTSSHRALRVASDDAWRTAAAKSGNNVSVRCRGSGPDT